MRGGICTGHCGNSRNMHLLIVAINEASMQAYFAVQSRLNLNIFDESLCDTLWPADYYRASQRVFQDVEVHQDSFFFLCN